MDIVWIDRGWGAGGDEGNCGPKWRSSRTAQCCSGMAPVAPTPRPGAGRCLMQSVPGPTGGDGDLHRRAKAQEAPDSKRHPSAAGDGGAGGRGQMRGRLLVCVVRVVMDKDWFANDSA